MRLLNAATKQLEEFVANDEIPPYAILSHTWGKEEVTLQDFSRENVERKLGYGKIKYSCDQARKDDLKWVWIDTCCIDKTSTAELSEAINSMFRWYRNAKVCYAYLSDVESFTPEDRVPGTDGRDTDKLTIEESRWFSRGWTLQELIAPLELVFFDHDWTAIGSRFSLADSLSVITGIPKEVLKFGPEDAGEDRLDRFSIAQKMSWAALRKTTRSEDLAYCLLGIFDVNMPLLYGEGLARAFYRLQEEILKATEDASIFAWGIRQDAGAPELAPSVLLQRFSPPVDELRGMLAVSPKAFAHSGKIIRSVFTPAHLHSFDPVRDSDELFPTMIMNRSVRLEVSLLCTPARQEKIQSLRGKSLVRYLSFTGTLACAILPCTQETDDDTSCYIGVLIRPLDDKYFMRVEEPVYVSKRALPLDLDGIKKVVHIKS